MLSICWQTVVVNYAVEIYNGKLLLTEFDSNYAEKLQKNSHKWISVLACFPVTISDQLQALITIDGYVMTSNTVARRFERSAGVRRFVENACDLIFSG